MQRNEVNFKALTFISEQTASTFNYEVKGVRALWDPSLSIPGTNRRGGWRCPVGTRYGGQITDRFGRSCGWGVARRIANQIADIGERLENIDDRKRNNRLAKRNARMQRLLARQQKPGLLERGARGIAEALDGGQPPQLPVADIDSVSPRPRRRRGKLRESEQRRMEREIVEPGAPRTGEPPKPNRPRGRRRAATQQGARRTARRKPEADFVDGSKPVPTAVPQRKPKIDLRERDSGLERLLDEEAEVERRVENALRLENVENEFFENLDEDALLRLMNQIKLLPDYQNRNDWKRLRREWNLRPREARDAATKRDMQRFNPPRREPPSAPPKPLAVEPDPDFNAPDLGWSLPDARSERNVRNRFREQGLPDTAYWREGAYQGDDNAELERRFGRYYDDNNQRNERGNYVNRRINAGGGKPANRSKPPARPKTPAKPKAPNAPAGPPPIRRVLDVDGQFNQSEDAEMLEIIKNDLNAYEPNAYNNLRGLSKEQLEGNLARLKQEQIALDQNFDIALDRWNREKIYNVPQRAETRAMLAQAHIQRERNKLAQEAVNLRMGEIDAGIEWRQKLPKQLPVFQAPDAPQVQTPQTPQAPVPAVVSVGSEVIPDDKIVPDIDAGGKAPRRIGRAQQLDEAVKALHENQGNLADIPDGIVIDAVVDGEFRDVGANRVLTDAEVASELKNGFHLRPENSKFENRRYKFEVMKNSAGAADVWVVLKVEDKTTGEKWFMKSSTYGDNDALLENVGMNAAQALEFGNNENHLRIGGILQNDRRHVHGAPPKPRRWVMMKDISQWENGMQGNWKDAKDGLDRVAADINPRDVGRILALDMVLDNQDRHGGNFMWARDGNRVRLGLIDHGLIGGGREYGASDREEWARQVIADPGARRYANEANNGIQGLIRAGYRVQNQRDARILKETLRRSVARLKRDLDKITGAERIEANGAKLSDAEKTHLALVKSVAEARIGWMENNLDAIVDFLR